MILGSDGVDMLEAEWRKGPRRTMEVDSAVIGELIRYYRYLNTLCPHKWDWTSPIDTAALCTKCGLLTRMEP